MECRGILDAETDLLIDEEIRRKCGEIGASRVLIDIRRMQGRLSMLENFQAGATFGRRLGGALQRTAIVDRTDEAHVERNSFFELVAVNRNVLVKFFGSIEAADAWLATGLETPQGDNPAPG